MSYHDFKWLFIINDMQLSQLETEYPCHFCKLNYRCYYHDHLEVNHHDYICPTTYQQVLTLRNIYNSIYLYNTLLITYLCCDLKNVILKLIFNDECECIQQRIQMENAKDLYFNYDFSRLTIKKLKDLMTKRKIKYRGCKLRSDYLNMLQNDLHMKRYYCSQHINYFIDFT